MSLPRVCDECLERSESLHSLLTVGGLDRGEVYQCEVCGTSPALSVVYQCSVDFMRAERARRNAEEEADGGAARAAAEGA